MFGSSNIVDRTEDCGNGFGWSIIEWDNDDFYGYGYDDEQDALCDGAADDATAAEATLADATAKASCYTK